MKKTLRPISNLRRKRKYGFLKRMRTRWGRAIINRRRRKQRKRLSV